MGVARGRARGKWAWRGGRKGRRRMAGSAGRPARAPGPGIVPTSGGPCTPAPACPGALGLPPGRSPVPSQGSQGLAWGQEWPQRLSGRGNTGGHPTLARTAWPRGAWEHTAPHDTTQVTPPSPPFGPGPRVHPSTPGTQAWPRVTGRDGPGAWLGTAGPLQAWTSSPLTDRPRWALPGPPSPRRPGRRRAL